MLEIGAEIPAFEVADQAGKILSAADLLGKPHVFFFYPKADTPGCTKEACAFSEQSGEFEKRGIAIYGVSADSPKKQQGFAKKYSLVMPLLADETHKILEPWGVWQEKKQYGRTYMGIVRSTFIVDAKGKVAFVFKNVKVEGHVDKVLAKVDELLQRPAFGSHLN